MSTDPFSDAKIVESWSKNAPSWTVAVREGQIESRRLITDQAIVDTILSRSPRSVLDIGCGEGWLARELATKNIDVFGVDVVPAFIKEAQRAGGGDFHAMSYEEIAAGKLSISVDVIVCNFALLGKESAEGVFGAALSLLNSQGSFLVQTLHPVVACGDLPYTDGWREGSWAGFSANFTDPAPWYFRTMENWIKLFVDSGFRLREVREPLPEASFCNFCWGNDWLTVPSARTYKKAGTRELTVTDRREGLDIETSHSFLDKSYWQRASQGLSWKRL